MKIRNEINDTRASTNSTGRGTKCRLRFSELTFDGWIKDPEEIWQVVVHTCCWDATPRPPPFKVLANIVMSNSGSSMSDEPSSRGPPLVVSEKSWEFKDPQSSTDFLPLDEPLMDAARDRASDSWSKTGLKRSSRNWSTSEACDGTRTRLTCDANTATKSTQWLDVNKLPSMNKEKKFMFFNVSSFVDRTRLRCVRIMTLGHDLYISAHELR